MDWFKVSCLCILGFFLKVNVQDRDIFWVAKIPLGWYASASASAKCRAFQRRRTGRERE